MPVERVRGKFPESPLQAEARANPAALRDKLDGLYAEHQNDAAVAVKLGVGVATLKRLLGRLQELGFALNFKRRPGRPWPSTKKPRKKPLRDARP